MTRRHVLTRLDLIGWLDTTWPDTTLHDTSRSEIMTELDRLVMTWHITVRNNGLTWCDWIRHDTTPHKHITVWVDDLTWHGINGRNMTRRVNNDPDQWLKCLHHERCTFWIVNFSQFVKFETLSINSSFENHSSIEFVNCILSLWMISLTVSLRQVSNILSKDGSKRRVAPCLGINKVERDAFWKMICPLFRNEQGIRGCMGRFGNNLAFGRVRWHSLLDWWTICPLIRNKQGVVEYSWANFGK